MIDRGRLTQLLKLHEGLRLKPYYDSVGVLTIGIGRSLDTKGITEQEAEILLANDIEEALTDLEQSFPWFHTLDPVRKVAIADMRFNVGAVGFRRFQRTITALDAGNYKRAAEEMLASRWAAQVGKRAERLAAMVRSAKWPAEVKA